MEKSSKKSRTLIVVLIMVILAVAGYMIGRSSVKGDGLFATGQVVSPSPEWVTKLDAAKDAEQLIVVAGVDKNTGYITMHEKGKDGTWQQIISSPGYIGLDGLGAANIEDAITPAGTFTIDRAFGIAKDPGCKMDYVQVDDKIYWSGDDREGMHFNELVSIDDLPDLDTENSEHIVDYAYQYQYCLNLGFNSECKMENGYAFFMHCFGKKPYTGGCVSLPENIMKLVMQNIKPGCKITIDTMENLGGSFN